MCFCNLDYLLTNEESVKDIAEKQTVSTISCRFTRLFSSSRTSKSLRVERSARTSVGRSILELEGFTLDVISFIPSCSCSLKCVLVAVRLEIVV
jgi:hypothetical protein